MTNPKTIFGFLILAFFITFFSSNIKQVNNGLVGHWQGSCKNENFTMQFSVDITKKDTIYSASFNSDEQRALNIPMQNFQLNNDIIHFELRGDNDTWIFDGKRHKENIAGQIRKGKQVASFSIDKKNLDYPYYETKDVTFQNDTVTLSGTLYLPNVKEKVPAILFMHGSGGEQRFSATYFADFLARKGIAVLIYDKRGAGRSTGNWSNSSFKDLANDAIAGIKLLESNQNIDPGKIGIYGHSQGGSICPMLLNMYPLIAFGISAASAGVSMEESDWYEVQNRFKNYVSGKDYENAMKVMENYLRFASTGAGYNELIAVSKKFEKEKWYQDYIGSIDTTRVSFFKYYRKIGSYNCIDYWKNVKQPCLILKGANDQTSPGYPSFQNIEDALKRSGNDNYKIVIFPNSTHEMHVSGSSNDFFFKATPGYCDTIYNWIKTRTEQ
jgi:dipeptidyl aminopeptidase/acylaminoacyl peptidase